MKSHIAIPTGKDRLSIPVSRVKGATNNKITRVVKLGTVLKNITASTNADFLKLSEDLKQLKESDPKQYSDLKTNKCEGFIIGRYEKRADKYCQEYYPLMGFDIDGLESDKLESTISDLKESPFVFCAFPSPSHRGIRIFIWSNATPKTHKATYQQICDYLSGFLRLPTLREKNVAHIDTGTNNLSRIWFFSHVPKQLFFLNLESEIFSPEQKKTVERPQTKKKQNGHKISLSVDEKIKICLDKVNRQNLPSGRNNLVYAVACEMCRHGVDFTTAVSNCLQFIDSDFGEPEIRKTVDSAYKAKTFGEFSDVQILAYQKKLNGTNGQTKATKEKPSSAPKQVKITEAANGKKKSKFVQIEEYLFGKYEFRRNVIGLDIEYRERGTTKEWEVMNDNDVTIELLRLGWTNVDSMVTSIFKSSLIPDFDPLKSYFESLPKWKEGDADFIGQLSKYVEINDREWFDTQFRKMLVRSAACGLNIIPFNKHCFTLVGKQNDGKTSFLRYLCPPKLSEYIKENLDLHNKDGHIALVTNFFINLDELAHLSKYDINKTKACFTRDKVKERLPYDKKATSLERRANFLASTNSNEFLTDETGNVRWLVFEIDGINHDNGGKNGYSQNIDIDKVWAQAYYLLQNGFDFKLRPDEISKSEQNNKLHQVTTTEQEFIMMRYEPSSKELYKKQKTEGVSMGEKMVKFKMTIDIKAEMEEALPKFKPSTKKIGSTLKMLGFSKEQLYGKNGKGNKLPIGGYFLTENNENDRLNDYLEEMLKDKVN